MKMSNRVSVLLSFSNIEFVQKLLLTEFSHNSYKVAYMALKGAHERLADRLANILVLLNQGEKLTVRFMAEKFNTSIKTAQRDIDRLDVIGLQQDEQDRYFLPSYLVGKFTSKDIERFATLTGIKGLFPGLGSEFLRDLFDQMLQGALLVKGHRYEDLSNRQPEFKKLQSAIVKRQLLDFLYFKSNSIKDYRDIEPYKLVNDKGIWYLAAVDQGKLKTFCFSKLQALRIKDQTFQPDASIEARIQEDESIWFSEDQFEVVLTVTQEAAAYFKRRNVIANQSIVKELQDGSLIVSVKVAHPMQVLPIVRYWIPHLRIISPEGMQASMEQQLSAYFERPVPGV